MKVHALIFLYSFLHNGKQQKECIIRSLFFVVILIIFSKFWQATSFGSHEVNGLMIWYLATTEAIVLSIPLIQIDIENDIRNGEVIYQLLKPVAYLYIKLAEAVGTFLFRFLVMCAVAVPMCIYLSDQRPSFHILLTVFFIAGSSGLVFILFHIAIGLTAFRFQDSTPLFWIWQRSSFLFGGLLIPLEFYPEWLRKISYGMPFSALIGAPAKLMLSFNLELVGKTLILIVIWAIVAWFVTSIIYQKMIRYLIVNGG